MFGSCQQLSLMLFTTRYSFFILIDVSEITDMEGLFYTRCTKSSNPNLNPDLSGWKVDKVTSHDEEHVL